MHFITPQFFHDVHNIPTHVPTIIILLLYYIKCNNYHLIINIMTVTTVILFT